MNLDLLNTRNIQNGRDYESDSSNYLKFNEQIFKNLKCSVITLNGKDFVSNCFHKSDKEEKESQFSNSGVKREISDIDILLIAYILKTLQIFYNLFAVYE